MFLTRVRHFRIDYGTGHEMAFIMFLACLFKVGALKTDNDEAAVGLILFDR
jgi:serine/threonine-protein phosphatase 2A activator